MSDLYSDEALDFPITNIADIIRIELDETLLTNDASQTQGLSPWLWPLPGVSNPIPWPREPFSMPA